MTPEVAEGGVSGASPPRKRPGGRSARIREAVLESTLELLAEDGFGSLTIERVAERSGTHKTTIYRRWGTREGLVGEALVEQSAREIPVPDTGTLRGDLESVGESVAATLATPLGSALARAMVGHGDDPEIARIAEEFWSSRFDRTANVVQRAIDRGEVAADTDRRLLVELVAGAVWFRSIARGQPVDESIVASVVDSVLTGARRT